MDVPPSADQALLLESSGRFVEDVWPLARIRALADGAAPDPGWVPVAAELGWFAMFVPDEHGGGSVSGDPVGDAVLLAQLRGAALLPEPFAATNAVAAVLARHAGAELAATVLPDLAAGKTTATLPVDAGVLQARAAGPDLVLDGRLTVDDPDAAWLLAPTSSGTVLLALDAGTPVTRTALSCLDPTRRLTRLDLTGLRVPGDAVLGDGVLGGGAAELARTVAGLLHVAGTVGAMDRLFTLTRQYALDRTAFGRPIGSFQALKHLLADVSLVLESAKAVLAAAGRAVAGDESYAPEVVAIAQAHISAHAAAFGQDCQQVFGGIGFAWEHDLHLYLRRITTDAHLHGTPDVHRDRVLAAHPTEEPA